jgi:hypothetical protein
MENDDWVKFGHVLWASHTGNGKKQILDRYKKAWRSIYNSQPRLEKQGPVDLLHDPKYTCHKPVPWRTEVEGRFSDPFVRQAPSTSAASASAPAPDLPIDPPPTLSVPVVAEADLSLDMELNNLLKKARPDIAYGTPFPRLKGGFFPGFQNYLTGHNPKLRVKVIFPIIPQYILPEQQDAPSCDAGSIQVDNADVEMLSEAEPGCIIIDQDQTNCPIGKRRILCNSWVSLRLHRGGTVT